MRNPPRLRSSGAPTQVEPAAELRTSDQGLRGLGIPEERVFEDAMWGKTMNRPGLQSLLSHVRPNDVVWVAGLDRLGRSTLATLQAMEELEQCGVRVRSAKPGGGPAGRYGGADPTDHARDGAMGRRQMLERVAEARAARIVAGLPGGRPKTALSDRQVRHIDALRSAGYSVKQIVGGLGISRASVDRALVLASAEPVDDPESSAPA